MDPNDGDSSKGQEARSGVEDLMIENKPSLRDVYGILGYLASVQTGVLWTAFLWLPSVEVSVNVLPAVFYQVLTVGMGHWAGAIPLDWRLA